MSKLGSLELGLNQKLRAAYGRESRGICAKHLTDSEIPYFVLSVSPWLRLCSALGCEEGN